LGAVNHVVLDEVDNMLDMGFAPTVEEILQFVYTEGNLNWALLLLRSSTVAVIAVVFSGRDLPPQTLLFSATCPSWVYKTAEKYMRKEQTAHVDTIGSSVNRTSTTVEHLAIRCQYHDRAACIGMLLLIVYPVTTC